MSLKKYLFTTLFISLTVIPLNITINKRIKASISPSSQINENSILSHQSTSKANHSAFSIIALAFGTGLLASFTPCIYPMIPVTIGVLQAQASASLLHNFTVSFTYVLGISTVYSALGYIAATTTVFFGEWLSNPWIIFFLILLFLYLAFSMFGFYEIHIPSFLKNRQQTHASKGSFLYAFLFGLLTGTAASPCLTPALAMLLGFVAKTGNPFLGFATLFSFSLGMGALLILIGTFSTTLMKRIPRAGTWMIDIKKIFGFAMFAVCVYFLQPFFMPNTITILYALVSASAAIHFFISKPKNYFKLTLSGISLLITIYLLYLLF